jgi:hypothetical protein
MSITPEEVAAAELLRDARLITQRNNTTPDGLKTTYAKAADRIAKFVINTFGGKDGSNECRED